MCEGPVLRGLFCSLPNSDERIVLCLTQQSDRVGFMRLGIEAPNREGNKVTILSPKNIGTGLKYKQA